MTTETSKKPNTSTVRNNQIKFRMSDDELKSFKDKLEASNQTMQTFIINAINNREIMKSDDLDHLIEESKILRDEQNQLRGMAVNVNQMAHIANGSGELPTENKLHDLALEIMDIRKECEQTWQLLNQLIREQVHTPQ